MVIATVFFGALFLIITRDALYLFEYRSVSYWVRIILSFGMYGGLAALSAFLLKKRDFFIAALAITLIYWFVFGFNKIYLVAGLIFLFFNLGYAVTVSKEKRERIRASITRIVARDLYFFIISVIILVSVGYFFLPSVQEKSERFEIPSAIQRAAETLSYNFLVRSAPDELKDQLGQSEEARSLFDLRVQEAVGQVLNQAQEFISPYLTFVPAVAAIGFFLALGALVWIWKLIIFLFASFIFTILKKTGFVKIELVEKQVEEIRL